MDTLSRDSQLNILTWAAKSSFKSFFDWLTKTWIQGTLQEIEMSGIPWNTEEKTFG